MSRDTLPSPRLLGQWWNQLQPSNILVGSIELLRVEALVARPVAVPTPPLLSPLFQALLIRPRSTDELGTLLGLDVGRVRILLATAEAAGWIQLTANRQWQMLLPNAHTVPIRERHRQRYAFRHGEFVPLADPGPFRWDTTATEQVPAEIGWDDLLEAQARDPQWQEQIGFPPEELIDPWEPTGNDDRGEAVPWERRELWSIVLVIDGEQVRGYLLPAGEWGEWPAKPAFWLPLPLAQAGFPEAANPPCPVEQQRTWDEWAQSRAVPLADFAPAGLDYHAGELIVHPSAELRDWLQTHRPDVVSGELWVYLAAGELHYPARLRLATS